MPILSVKKLNVTLDGNRIIRDISFEIEKGESLAVIGPNGSGKTVLLKSLIGLLPSTGEISWKPDIKIGYVPQKIDADRHLPVNARDLLEAKANILKIKKEEVTAV